MSVYRQVQRTEVILSLISLYFLVLGSLLGTCPSEVKNDFHETRRNESQPGEAERGRRLSCPE